MRSRVAICHYADGTDCYTPSSGLRNTGDIYWLVETYTSPSLALTWNGTCSKRLAYYICQSGIASQVTYWLIGRYDTGDIGNQRQFRNWSLEPAEMKNKEALEAQYLTYHHIAAGCIGQPDRFK